MFRQILIYQGLLEETINHLNLKILVPFRKAKILKSQISDKSATVVDTILEASFKLVFCVRPNCHRLGALGLCLENSMSNMAKRIYQHNVLNSLLLF